MALLTNGTVRDVEIPVLAGYTCASAKDAVNTIADAQAMSVSGTKWVFPGAFSLVAGDSTDDNIVDVPRNVTIISRQQLSDISISSVLVAGLSPSASANTHTFASPMAGHSLSRYLVGLTAHPAGAAHRAFTLSVRRP